jgi:hypothetical protein
MLQGNSLLNTYRLLLTVIISILRPNLLLLTVEAFYYIKKVKKVSQSARL